MQTDLSHGARRHALHVLRQLQDAGHEALLAGGCVRDHLLGREAKDFDVATSAGPDEVAALFSRTSEVGKHFGVVLVHEGDQTTEVATFRSDDVYEDGRRPRRVHFTTADEDAHRRDFTVNALFYDPVNDRLHDYVGGQEDIANKLIRTVGRPQDRFAEDHLRMLRAVRFASTLEFSVEEKTLEAIKEHAGYLSRISAERIQHELNRILLDSPRPGAGLRLLLDAGLLEQFLPEVAALAGQEQPPQFHPEGDVFTHTCMMLDAMKHPTLTLAYAVLLHDVGKPPTAKTGVEPDGSTRIRFNGHAKLGAEMSRSILDRLRMPRQHIEAVAHCVANHMKFMDVPRMRTATLRRLTGALTFPVELELHRLDCLCSHGDTESYDFLLDFLSSMKDQPVLPERWITGEDVMALGIPEGPAVGRWLKETYDAQLEGRHENREQLLEWLQSEIARNNSE